MRTELSGLSGTQRRSASTSGDRFCNLIAILFMPQASSAYAFLGLSLANGIERTFSYLLLAIFFASVVQLISLYVYARRPGKDPNVQNRRERPILFLGAVVSYFVGFVGLRLLGAPFIVNALMFAYFVNITMATVITEYVTKVSIHTWGITGPALAILYSFGVLGFVLMLVLGALVGSTRVRLGSHTWGQVVLSFLVSIPLTWLVVYVLPVIFPAILETP